MNNSNDFWDSVLLVIVLYKEELLNSKTFSSIEKASKEMGFKIDLFVYDNSPYEQKLIQKKESNFNIVYVSDINNSGLSKAYNSGIKHANTNNKKYILLLDQDTEFSTTFFKSYKKAAIDNKELDIFAPKLLLNNGKIFSPCVYKYKRGWYPENVEFGKNNLKNLVPVNSGVMISMKLINKVGGYNENLKVDFIDFQFMERAINYTDSFFLINEIGQQEFSDDSDEIDGQITRFKIYLADVKAIDKCSIMDSIIYSSVVLLHSVKLSLKFRDLTFIKILINE